MHSIRAGRVALKLVRLTLSHRPGRLRGRRGGRVTRAEIWLGTDAALIASAYVEQLIVAGRTIREILLDPMRFSSEACFSGAPTVRSSSGLRTRAG